MTGMIGLTETNFFGINEDIKAQLNNEGTLEPNQSQQSHEIATDTVMSNKK